MPSTTIASDEDHETRTGHAHGWAVASVVLAVLWAGGVGSLLAIVYAVRARRAIRREGGARRDQRLAGTGFWLGTIGIMGAVVVWVLVVYLALNPLRFN